jgi:ribA/ribD-fused uncharacterized protein
MMHSKALLFSTPTHTVTRSIMSSPAPSPAKIRALGRKIPDFDEKVWNDKKYEIVLRGTELKFGQNDRLRELLLKTGSRELVEASPYDRVWGVGFAAKVAGAHRENWGENLLGRCLMEVRERLRKEE